MTALLILAAFGVLTALVGRAKGSSPWIWFTVGFFLGPLGLLAAILFRSESDEPERRCPRCGSIHKLYVQVCTNCGEDMYLPDVDEVWTPSAGQKPPPPPPAGRNPAS